MIQSLKKNQFLLEELVKRDFKTKYKRSILGVAWSVLNPLATLLIMRVVFSHFFGSTIEHYTTYLFCGNIIFSLFVETTSESMLALLGNAAIFSKVNVPKTIFITAKNVQTMINFAVTLFVFFVLCLLDGITFSLSFLMLVYPVLMLFVFNLGIGLILSAMYVFFRDIRYLWNIVTQLLMYVSAIFYSIETFPEKIRMLFNFNPVYLFISYFRSVVINGVVPDFSLHVLIFVYSIGFFSLGIYVYKKYDNEFIYYI